MKKIGWISSAGHKMTRSLNSLRWPAFILKNTILLLTLMLPSMVPQNETLLILDILLSISSAGFVSCVYKHCVCVSVYCLCPIMWTVWLVLVIFRTLTNSSIDHLSPRCMISWNMWMNFPTAQYWGLIVVYENEKIIPLVTYGGKTQAANKMITLVNSLWADLGSLGRVFYRGVKQENNWVDFKL